MKNAYKFFTQMFSGANHRISSKRVFGASILTVITIAVIVKIFIGDNPIWLGEAILMLIGVAAGLLGLGVLEKKYDNINKSEEENNE